MKFAVVIDSMASLPEFVLRQRPIEVLPIAIKLGDEEISDKTSASQLIEIYSSGRISPNTEIYSRTPTTEEIHDFIVNKIVSNYDYAICQSVSRSASTIYDSFVEVSETITKEAHEIRQQQSIVTPFRLTCMNTGTIVSGQGLLAIYADYLFSKEADFTTFGAKLNRFKTVCKSFTVVKDTMHARHRAKLRGVDTVGLPTALIGKAVGLAPIVLMQSDVNSHIAVKPGYEKMVNRLLSYVCEQIEHGLYLRFVNICYAGDLKDIQSFDQYQRLVDTAKAHKVKILESVMSLAAGVNYGPQAFSVGIAPKNHTAEP